MCGEAAAASGRQFLSGRGDQLRAERRSAAGIRKIRGADRLQPLVKEGTGRYDCRLPKRKFAKHPYFTQSGKDREAGGDQYIANMQDGAVAGFKYFVLGEADKIAVEVRGSADGAMQVSADADFSRLLANIEIHGKRRPGGWFCGSLAQKAGNSALFFRYCGTGSIDFLAFELRKKRGTKREKIQGSIWIMDQQGFFESVMLTFKGENATISTV